MTRTPPIVEAVQLAFAVACFAVIAVPYWLYIGAALVLDWMKERRKRREDARKRREKR